MGNRAMVVFKSDHSTSPAVYLHWNGGPESVYTFLEYMEKVKCRMDSYGAARLCQIVGNYFKGTLSLGVVNVNLEKMIELDPGDNGVYIYETTGFQEKERTSRISRYIWGHWLSEKGVEEERAAARLDAYNRDGDLMAEIAKVNDQFFSGENAD